jgi:pimeloyl-ACP methyl ester carboxylesterase
VVVGALALVWAGAANAATPQQLTVTVSDGAKLACSVTTPDGSPPTGGWPGVMLFHGLGGKHQDVEPIATGFLAPAGYASIACDARGHGASPCCWALAAPPVVQDVKDLFAYFTTRPDVSDTQIGALGISLGGGTIWNAATSGVPFKALVPVITWTNLQTALAPQGFAKLGLVLYLSGLVPQAMWSPILTAAAAALTAGNTTGPGGVDWNANQSIQKLQGFSTPTLMVQGRHDFLFDIDQVLATYTLLQGPKRLYLGDVGHAPAPNPTAEQPYYFGLAVKWFDRYLKGTQNGVEKTHVELAHDPWDGKTTTYTAAPPTKTISVNLPGSTTLHGAAGKAVRSVRVTGGPHETFGDSTVTVRYSGAQGWDRLVAVLCVQGSSTPISVGGVKITGVSGTATIKLMNESVKFAAGKKLVLYLGPTSLVQDPGDAVYIASVQPTAQITLGKATLKLSVLKKAVSK